MLRLLPPALGPARLDVLIERGHELAARQRLALPVVLGRAPPLGLVLLVIGGALFPSARHPVEARFERDPGAPDGLLDRAQLAGWDRQEAWREPLGEQRSQLAGEAVAALAPAHIGDARRAEPPPPR